MLVRPSRRLRARTHVITAFILLILILELFECLRRHCERGYLKGYSPSDLGAWVSVVSPSPVEVSAGALTENRFVAFWCWNVASGAVPAFNWLLWKWKTVIKLSYNHATRLTINDTRVFSCLQFTALNISKLDSRSFWGNIILGDSSLKVLRINTESIWELQYWPIWSEHIMIALGTYFCTSWFWLSLLGSKPCLWLVAKCISSSVEHTTNVLSFCRWPSWLLLPDLFVFIQR